MATAQPNPADAFGVRLREMRESARLTLQELADRAGLNLHTIARIERGERKPQWATVVALAAALRVHTDAFLPR